MPILIPMTQAAFARYYEESIAIYAEEKIRAGEWQRDEALGLSRKYTEELLPQGLATPDHHFFEIHGDAGAVGVLWVAEKPRGRQRVAYVYEVLVRPPHQGQGHGTRAFHALEEWARERGLAGLELQVFGHNPGAQKLYRRLGFRTTNVRMFKPVATS